MKISVESLKLFDKEKDIKLFELNKNYSYKKFININKRYKSIKEYQTLIKKKNIKNNINMFSYLNIYNDISKENKTELNLNNINYIVTFDALTRIYTFSMYYYNIFYENYINSNTEHKKEFNKSHKKEKELSKNKIQKDDDEINNQIEIE